MLPCKMFGYFTGSQMQASQDHSICFRREVIDIYRRKYLSRHRGVGSVGRPILFSSRKLVKVPEIVRFDGQGHCQESNVTQRIYAYYEVKVKFICEKCNVGFHIDCFSAYHNKQ